MTSPRASRPARAIHYLFVATFPVANAYDVTLKEASKSGAVKIRIANGGVAFYPGASPSNVYIAFPGVDQQIEVFTLTRRGRRARESGAIEPVDLSRRR